MTTLHIQVPIHDLSAWRAGFAAHEDARREAGVRKAVVRHPVGDELRLVVDLDFETVPEAEAFLGYLRENVWKDQPILAGPPEAWILETVDLS